jgi:hypothetical protein
MSGIGVSRKLTHKQLKSFTDQFWDELYRDFLLQDMNKRDFLTSRGIPQEHAITRSKTLNWGRNTKMARNNLRFLGNKYINLGVGREVAQILELVKTWKNDLSVNHYKAAQLCLAHAELALAEGLELDTNGNAIRSKLTSRTLKDLTNVIGEVQKIQRTALGLPGETTGVITADVTKKDNARPDFVFNVMVNENGKFVNPRPELEYDKAAAEEEDEIAGAT